MNEREDLAMKNQRTFSLEFKRQVVEELLSGESRQAQLCRRHNISSSLLYHWKKQYSRGKLTLENEFLKKGLQNSLSPHRRNGKSSPGGSTSSVLSSGGAG